MKYLLIIFLLLSPSVSWSDDLYVCKIISETKNSNDLAYGSHILGNDITDKRLVKQQPELLKLEKDILIFNGITYKKLTYEVYHASMDILYFYQPNYEDDTKMILMYYYNNSYQSRETFYSRNSMYYCDKK